MSKERHKICEGSVIKFNGNVRAGIINGVPYWKFPLGMSTIQDDGEINTYEWVWLKTSGRCDYKQGDWLKITRIISYSSALQRNITGGITIYRTIECDFRRMNYKGE